MKPALGALMIVGAVSVCFGAQPAVDSLREQLRIQQDLLADEMSEVGPQRADLREAWVRVARETDDFQQAQRQGESLESLKLRDADLRRAESELMGHLFALQRQRKSMLMSHAIIAATEEQIQSLEGQVAPETDPLSGYWRMAVEPGNLEGFMSLRLDGTLVQGTYSWSGDWSGSFRGTFVANKVRLEMIDARQGFAAILRGKIIQRGSSIRLGGSWEGTELAVGLPSTGSWFAERVDELPE
jgi:hypothetical protein